MPVIISDALVLAGETDGVPLGHARILYDDVFGLSDTVLVPSTEAAGFEAENAADYLTYDFWKATVLPATLEAQAATAHEINYMLIAAHSAGDEGASFQPQYHDGSGWVDLAAETNPGSNRVVAFLFESVIASRVRVLVDGSGDPPSLGVVMAGKALAMEMSVPMEHRPAPFARKTSFSVNASENGQILGRSVRREGVEIPIAFNHLTNEFVRAEFEPFIDHARNVGGFGWLWSPVDYPDDVAYCVCETDINPEHAGLSWRMNVEFVAKGMLE